MAIVHFAYKEANMQKVIEYVRDIAEIERYRVKSR